jgi:adenylylsulfate kinase
MDKVVRTVAKTATWRIIASLYTGIIAFLLTGAFSVAAAVMGGEVIVKIMLYFLHERAWSATRWGMRNEDGIVIWLTGLPSSGKTTLAERLKITFEFGGAKVELLDGDIIRNLFPNTGFSKEDRDKHICRVGYMASLLAKHGAVVLCSFVSPYKATRQQVREMCKQYVEVFVDCPVEQCIKRDVKGLYAKSLSGEIKQFTGVDDPYEPPDDPEIHVHTDQQSIEESKEEIVNVIKQKRPGLLPAFETIDALEP